MLGTDLTEGLNDPNSRDHPSRGYAEAHLPGCQAALAGEHGLEIGKPGRGISSPLTSSLSESWCPPSRAWLMLVSFSP